MISNYNDDIINSLKILEEGGLILYPTDTIWGLGCDATNESAVAKIFSLKSRVDTKALIIFVKDQQQLLHYVSKPSPVLFDYQQKQPRPTTAIYSNAINLPQNLTGTDNSIAIRIPSDPFCLEMLVKFGKPIVSTSANISGLPSPSNFNDISNEIKSGVDYIVKHRQNDLSLSTPSMIIMLENDQVKILRS